MFYDCLSALRPADCSRWQVKCARSQLRSVRVKLGRGKRLSELMSQLEEKLRLSPGTFHSMSLYFYCKEQRMFQKELVDVSSCRKSELEDDGNP